YSDQFLIVPPRQIGIAAPAECSDFLKALTLYLNSDFVIYHQFLTTPQLGIKREVATLRSLKELPVPFAPEPSRSWKEWEQLHEKLVEAEAAGMKAVNMQWYAEGHGAELLKELNAMVSEMLAFDQTAQAAI